jgi:hypothetical protein
MRTVCSIVVAIDEGVDVAFECGDAAATLDLTLNEEGAKKLSTWSSQEIPVRFNWIYHRGRLANESRIRLVSWVA